MFPSHPYRFVCSAVSFDVRDHRVGRSGWQPGPLGSMHRPDYFYGGYAVHGITSVPAYPASHGCIRMTVSTMDRMWSSLWAGMPVAIYSS